MYNIKLWFHEHRKFLWKVIVIVVFFILLIRVLNYLANKEIHLHNTSSYWISGL